MILGIGTDVIEVQRIRTSLEKEGFKQKVFTANEIAYCEKENGFRRYAARFAAKEAFFKALGTGWVGNMEITEVEVISDSAGKPGIQLHGETARIFDSKRGGVIHLSMSHINNTAVAFVVIEKQV